jgi:predicted house-cleaning noncanonical NTP pyrophosphatase (MazG superfamily)
VEELADLLEIIQALAKHHGSSIEEVEKVRKEKAEKRGGFEDKIFLIEVED